MTLDEAKEIIRGYADSIAGEWYAPDDPEIMAECEAVIAAINQAISDAEVAAIRDYADRQS